MFRFRYFETQIFDIFRPYNFTCTESTSIENPSAVPLCKSIGSAIQWFQLHYEITFVTIHNPAVYLSGARVSISPILLPRLEKVP